MSKITDGLEKARKVFRLENGSEPTFLQMTSALMEDLSSEDVSNLESFDMPNPVLKELKEEGKLFKMGNAEASMVFEVK